MNNKVLPGQVEKVVKVYGGAERESRRSRSLRFLLCVVTAAICLSMPRDLQAAAGDLDPTFGSGGLVTTDFNNGNDWLGNIAIQKDGKIVAVGDTHSSNKFVLSRYNPDGSLDTTFGSGGKVVTVIANVNEYAAALAILPNGKILVCGNIGLPSITDTSFALLRYNTDGSLDTTFGNNGITTTNVGPVDDQAYSVALQSNGKIVVAGRKGIQFYPSEQRKGNVALARYNSEGILDTSFGNGGIKTNDFGQGLESYAIKLMVQPDDRLVIAGGSSYEFLVARYDSNGTLDLSFSSDGFALANFSSNWDAADDAVLQPDGKIVLVGWAEVSSPYDNLALARYNSDGSFDQTFGTGGKVLLSNYGDLDAVALMKNGKLVALGSSGTSMMVLRFDRNGFIDPKFGNGGIVNTNFGTAAAEGSDIALQADGKIVIGGLAATDIYFQHTDFGLARYLNPQTDRAIPTTWTSDQ